MRTGWILCISLCLASSLAAGEVVLKDPVKKVTVYTRGSARVTRQAPFSVAAGVTVLKSSALPAHADTRSLQIRLPGAKGIKIDAVETRRELIDQKSLEGKRAEHRQKIEAQEEKVFAISLELQALMDRQKGENETLAFLDQLRKQASQTAGREMAVQKMNVETWKEALALSRTRADESRKMLRGISREMRGVQKKLRTEQRILKDMQSKMPREIYETKAFITVSAEAPVEGTAELIYTVNAASWEPQYRVQADLEKKQVSLDILGSVRQFSGEDWDGVELSLSTARPDLGTDVPVLRPWYIRYGALPNQAAQRRREPGAVTGRPGGGTAGGESAQGGALTVFTAMTKARIPADNQRHRIPVQSFKSPVEIRHISVPKLIPHAFILAKATNKASYPMLPGMIEVTVGNSYVGRGMMQMTAPGEAIELSLGVDESIKVEHRLLDDKFQRRRRGSWVTTTNAYRITAANYGKNPVNLQIMDQLPISQHGDVKVSYGREATKALRDAEFPGQLQWNVKIEPGKNTAVEFDFTMEYPEHMKQQLQKFNRKQNAQLQQLMDKGLNAPDNQYEVQEENVDFDANLKF